MNCNKYILQIYVIILLLVIPLRSQVGIKGGLAISDIVFAAEGQTPYLGYEINYLTHRLPYLTYQVGIFKTYMFSKNFAIQPELLFVQKGLNYSMDFIYDDITYIIRISYLEVPLLLKYKLFNMHSDRFALLAGPYIAYMVNNKRVREINGAKRKDDMSNINRIDFGVLTGLSYDFKLFQSRYVLDLRTEYSLINMMDRLEGFVPRYYGPAEERVRNVNIALTLGYYF